MPVKTPLIHVTSKVADTVSFVAPIAKFIADEYGHDPAEYREAVQELTALRDANVVCPAERHDQGLQALQKYYAFFCSLASRFPISVEEQWNGVLPVPVKINFAWSEVFQSSGLFAKKKIAKENANFEKACVLFNIAALHSQIASVQNLGSDDGLKAAAKNFQASAVVFNNLKKLSGQWFRPPPSADLHPELIDALEIYMLAQAQEIMWHKCVQDKRPDSIVSRLSAQTAKYFDSAVQLLSNRAEVDKTWTQTAMAKAAFYHADAQMRAAGAAGAADKYGEQIARLRQAQGLANRAAQIGREINFTSGQELLSRIAQTLPAVEKENSLIYIQLIPEPGSLVPVDPHSLVSSDKPLPDYAETFDGVDPFRNLVPLTVVRAVEKYHAQRDELVDTAVHKLRDSTQAVVSAMSEMNLPGAIEALESPVALPDALLEKVKSVREFGGVEQLRERVQNIPSLAGNCLEVLTETEQMLDQEEQEDTQLRQQHGGRWSRTPSRELTGQTHEEAGKYKAILEKSAASDKTVREKYQENEPGFVILSKTPEELQTVIPAAQPAPAGSIVGLDALKEALAELDVLRAKRDEAEAAIKQIQEQDDIAPKLIAAQEAPEQPLFDEQKQQYSAILATVDQLVADTEITLAKTAEANTAFVEARSSGAMSERERMLSDLASKYESFLELSSNLTEGTKFYGNLTALLMKFQNKVKDFCHARKVEKTQLLSDLTHDIAATPHEQYTAHGAGPSVTTAASSQQPPPRPQQPPQQQPPQQQQQQQPPQQQQQQPPQQQQQQPPQQQQQQPPSQQQQQPGYQYPPPQGGGYPAYPPPQAYPTPGYQPQQQQPPYGYSSQQTPSPTGYPPQYGAYPPPQAYPPQAQPTYGYNPYAPPGSQPQQQPPPGSYGAPTVGGEWACRTCTFHNNPQSARCEMCDQPR